MTSSLVNQLNKITITQSMLNNLAYDGNMETSTKITPAATTRNSTNSLAMVILHQSDIDAATYHLAKSINDPKNSTTIQCVFVQESCVERLSASLKSKLKTHTKDESLEKSKEIVSRLSAKTISPETGLTYASILVWDFPQEHFTGDGKNLPIVCLFSFRTVKELIAMIKKEANVEGAIIWCENQAMAYEVIAATPFKDCYLNCFDVSWAPIKEYIDKAQPFALVENSYHYETLQIAGKLKNIVFPFGTIFAN